MEDVLINSLTDVEVPSALFSRLPAAEARFSYEGYLRDCSRSVYRKLPVTEAIFQRAQLLAVNYSGALRLRSLDLLHLATTLEHGADAIATYDRRLASAAAELGLAVVGARP